MSESLLALRQCPRCSGEKLVRVHAGEAVNFFCEDCAMCWHRDGGHTSLVDSLRCPGCELSTLGWWCA